MKVIGNPATIDVLQQPTSYAWVEQAITNLDIILLDHAHCELKAASSAIHLMFRYPSKTKMVQELTKIAKEELEHFDQVNNWLEKRNIPMAPLNAPPYGAALKAQIRHQEPLRFLDSLLVSGLIEARSHERLGLLSTYCLEVDLAAFYSSLMSSEARHYGVYWRLADTYFARDIFMSRLQELALLESELLTNLYPQPRVHS